MVVRWLGGCVVPETAAETATGYGMTVGTLYCILVAYDRDRSTGALAKLRRLVGRLRRWRSAVFVLVANADVEISGREGEIVVRGSNDHAEFSGWQEGLDAVRGRLRPQDAVLFCNDTAFSNRIFPGFLSLYYRRAIDRIATADNPVYLGETMRSRGDFVIDGLRFPRWISTYMFLLNVPALERLDYRILRQRAFDIEADMANGRLHSTYLSDDLQRHVNGYLLTRGVRSWYRADALQTSNADVLKIKAGCIVNEMYLTALALTADVELCDIFGGNIVVKRMRTLQHFFVEVPCLLMTGRYCCCKD